MKTSDFNFELPTALIAQTPLKQRDASRLLTLSKSTGKTAHMHFFDLPALLKPGDCLVLNDSRVLPARLIGQRSDTGSAVELVLLHENTDGLWECLVRPGRHVKTGVNLTFGNGLLKAQVMSVDEGGNRLIRFFYEGIFLELLERLGQMPLPPYIKEKLEESERYQTVYSKHPGSAAAPTAGLHFTCELLEKLREMGVRIAYLTLHVGLGTFRPVKAETITDHRMHAEFCIISQEAAKAVNETRQSGGRIVAVGTTSCRTLESFSSPDGTLRPVSGWTDIFIYPGYQFKCVDALITNFHLPQSTLIMLVSALAGREQVLAAYREAVDEKYRFFSFGDAMFIY